jgi:hypothetical protein
MLPIFHGDGSSHSFYSTFRIVAVIRHSTRLPSTVSSVTVAYTMPVPSTSPDVLRQALTAYLQPLLKKHSLSTSTLPPSDQSVLVYEDLTASWKAADAILKSKKAPTDVVVRRLLCR